MEKQFNWMPICYIVVQKNVIHLTIILYVLIRILPVRLWRSTAFISQKISNITVKMKWRVSMVVWIVIVSVQSNCDIGTLSVYTHWVYCGNLNPKDWIFLKTLSLWIPQRKKSLWKRKKTDRSLKSIFWIVYVFISFWMIGS